MRHAGAQTRCGGGSYAGFLTVFVQGSGLVARGWVSPLKPVILPEYSLLLQQQCLCMPLAPELLVQCLLQQ